MRTAFGPVLQELYDICLETWRDPTLQDNGGQGANNADARISDGIDRAVMFASVRAELLLENPWLFGEASSLGRHTTLEAHFRTVLGDVIFESLEEES